MSVLMMGVLSSSSSSLVRPMLILLGSLWAIITVMIMQLTMRMILIPKRWSCYPKGDPYTQKVILISKKWSVYPQVETCVMKLKLTVYLAGHSFLVKGPGASEEHTWWKGKFYDIIKFFFLFRRIHEGIISFHGC